MQRQTLMFGNFTAGHFSDFPAAPIPTFGIGGLHHDMFYVAEPLGGRSIYDLEKKFPTDQKGDGAATDSDSGEKKDVLPEDGDEKRGEKRKAASPSIEESLRHPIKIGTVQLEEKKDYKKYNKKQKLHKFKVI